MPRTLAMIVVLSLLGVGPVPLSACALMSAKPAECSATQTQSLCENMGSAGENFRFAAPSNASCCWVQAPVPASKYEVPASAVDIAAVRPLAVLDSPVHAVLFPVLEFVDTSPPNLQSVLCTFLI